MEVAQMPEIEAPGINVKVPGFQEVEMKLREVLTGADGIIKDMCLSLLNSGGKRLRPMMVIYSGLCFKDICPELIHTAAAAELIHMASLVHDDIIDKSDSRRGNMTINSIFGNHCAVLAGDYIFAKAFSILSYYNLSKSMGYLVEAIQEMCDGEVNQAADGFNLSVTIDNYFRRISKKTAVLLSACCRAGAAAVGSSQREIDIMDDYGMNVGYAFQIIDDILDFTGDNIKLGKPKGADLMNGNITLPVILLMQDEHYGMWIRKILQARNLTKNEIVYIYEMLLSTGAIDRSFNIAKKCIYGAKSSILKLSDSPYRAVLLDLADKVISRDH